MAVVSDVIEICRNIQAHSTGAMPLRSLARLERRPIRPLAELESRYYLRFSVEDRPGVLGQITTALGAHEVSIAQVLQEGPRDPGRPVQVVVVTHRSREGHVAAALAEIAKLPSVAAPTGLIRVAE
jgi:homoserine dehydrogenase